MTKTTDEVYRDRNLAALAFAHAVNSLADSLREAGYSDTVVRDYRAGWRPPENEDDADAGEWAIVTVLLPEGQVSWHVPRDLAEASDVPRKQFEWDGHSREEKNARLQTFAGLDAGTDG